MILSDENAEKLILEDKKFLTPSFLFPDDGGKVLLKGAGVSSRTEFIIDVNRNCIILDKITMQERVYSSIPLLRLDLDTKPHHNPDDTMVSGNHLHVYREDYDAAFAYELSDPVIKKLNPSIDLEMLARIQDARERFKLFAKFCRFMNLPEFSDNKEDEDSLF